MRPAYNIKEESNGEWKTFIANDQFNDLLKKVISAVRNNDADTHKSIWIAGTYGSGKSHAGAVIQHLLCDKVEDIKDYVDEEYQKDKYETLRSSIFSLRKSKRLFPVNLYGQQNISHEEDLSLQLQREIKKALSDAGLDITVQTDFDSYIEHIDSQPHFWESLIAQNFLLASRAPDVAKLKQRLAAADTDVLDCVRQALRKGGYDIRLQSHNLQQWIFEVQEVLRAHSDYKGLLLIWDEFTEIMKSSIGRPLLTKIQEIAEATMNSENDTYFLFISHPSALLTLEEKERERTKGRYHYITYNMEPVSAFKIMSKKFKVVNYDLYLKHQERFFGLHPDLLDMFSSSSTNTEETKDNIKNLFPLHPGTANLATYFAREAGSSSRSVFDFLASDAVREFLEDDKAYLNDRTITADYLWDYVQSYFEADASRFGAVTERFNSHHLAVESQGETYLKVFKCVLLLNALNNIANSSTVTPSLENIQNLFVGTEYEGLLAEILDFFNDKSIIQRQPSGNFSILFTALPGEEIQKIKEQLKCSSYLYSDQVIKFGDTARTFFNSNLSLVLRPLNYQFFSLQGNEYTLISRVGVAKSQAMSYETFLAIMVGRTAQEIIQLKEISDKYSKDEKYDSIVFVVMEAPMGEKDYERFIEYQANAQCAQSHGLPQQHQTYSQQAGEMIKAWVTKMRGNSVTFYLKGENFTVYGSKMTSIINSAIAPSIFTNGPESLELIRSKGSSTYWKKASVKSTVDTILSYNTKQDIIDKLVPQAKHFELLLQDSVNDNLEWKDDIKDNHPLKVVCDYVDEWLGGKHTNKNQSFNLGDKLIGLTKPPFGLFQSYAPMGMVAFAMRKYANVIFDANGKPRTAQHLVDDVVELFRAWESGRSSNKLVFMFESKEAGKVSKYLIKMFNLNKLKGYADISSLKDARWVVLHEYSKDKGYPLWSLKHAPDCTDILKDFIENLMKVVSDPESMKNPNLLNAAISGYDALKTDLGNLLLPSEDNFRKGFVAYLKSIDTVNVQDAEVDQLIEHLHGHLEGEVGLWSEEKVSQESLKWRILQQRSQDTEGTIAGNGNGEEKHPWDDWGENRSSQEEELKKKRSVAMHKVAENPNLKEALENLINAENGYIIDILMKYV